MPRVTCQKLFARTLVQQHVDVIVSRGPRIAQQFTAAAFKLNGRIVAQKVQCHTQRIAPRLVPTSFTAGVTTAVARPTADAMRTTPRASLALQTVVDLDRKLRRMGVEIFAVVC